MVLLRHVLADGSWHFDWMLERALEAGGPLVTFRVNEALDALPQVFVAQSIGDHRREYLEYEGAVSGGRGAVVRVGRGSVEYLSVGADEWVVKLVWEGRGEGVYRGKGIGDQWRFEVWTGTGSNQTDTPRK
jgi:hypothetical protein